MAHWQWYAVCLLVILIDNFESRPGHQLEALAPELLFPLFGSTFLFKLQQTITNTHFPIDDGPRTCGRDTVLGPYVAGDSMQAHPGLLHAYTIPAHLVNSQSDRKEARLV